MATVHSIVRVKQPGHPSSYPVGRFEVSFTQAYGPSMGFEFRGPSILAVIRKKSNEEAWADAWDLAMTMNRCRADQGDNRLWYEVQTVDEESPKRAPPA